MRFRISLFILIFFSRLASAQTFTASPNQVCAEGTTLNFPLNVSGAPNTSNSTNGFYEVCVTLNHASAADVHLGLYSPSGSYAVLSEYNGGTNNNFTSACFRLYASSSIRYANAPFSGAYMAYDNLSSFTNGQNPNGSWTLYYLDNNVNSITGTLVSWSISFVTNPELTALNNSTSNIPIFKIDVPSGNIPDDPKVPGTIKIIDNISGINNFNATTYTNQYNLLIERQGYTSAWNDKPNYDLEFQNTAANNDTAISFLGLPKQSDWILKACVTDEYLMKDPLTFEMSRRMGYYAPRTKFCELVVNGVYAGMYILTEKVKRDSNRVDISKLKPVDTSGVSLTGGYIIEINPNGDPPAWWSNYPGYQFQNLTSQYEYKVVYPKQNTLPTQQLNYIHSFVDSFEDALQSPNYQDPTIGWRKFANEKHLIDFLIVSEYSTNYDTYGRSTYLYKEKSTDGGKLHCGPPWDADRGYCCDTGWVHIITHGYWIFPFWWQRLRTDSVFNTRLSCRYSNLRKTIFTDAAFDNYIDSNEVYTRNAKQRNVNRWQNVLYDINSLKTNVHNRLAWMQNNLTDTVYAPLPLTNTTYCAGDPVNIFIGNQYTYNFVPGPDTSFYIPTVAGVYQGVVETNYGCKTSQAINITPNPDPQIMGNKYPCQNTVETYTIMNIPGTNYIWTIYGGTPVSGCGSSDSSCTVQWGLPNFCMVKVKQSLTASCADTAIYPITLQTCLGINEVQNETLIQLFPNPVHDQVLIQSNRTILQSEIYDISGKRLFIFGNQLKLPLSSLASGTYWIKILAEDKKWYMRKLIKE